MMSIDLIDGSCLRRFASLQPFESYPAFSFTIRSPRSRLFIVGLVFAGGDRWEDELPHEAALRPVGGTYRRADCDRSLGEAER